MYVYYLQVLKNIISNTVHAPFWNNVLKVLLAGWLFFAGIHSYIFCILALTILDVVTGIIASIKKGNKFKSRILRKGLIEKVLLYLVLLISVFILELVIKTAINYTAFYMVLVATVCICTYELSSILENLYVIRPDMKFIKRLIKLSNKIQNKALDVAENKIDKIDNITNSEAKNR